MKAKLFQKNDGIKILVTQKAKTNPTMFEIKDIPFEGILQNELTYVGEFEGNNKEELISLLDPDMVVVEDTEVADFKIKYEMIVNTTYRYLLLKVHSIAYINKLYPILLLFNQFSSIKHKLN
mgnify:CR=1 FL=1